MKFKINDAVSVLDDDLSGTIININGSKIEAMVITRWLLFRVYQGT